MKNVRWELLELAQLMRLRDSFGQKFESGILISIVKSLLNITFNYMTD